MDCGNFDESSFLMKILTCIDESNSLEYFREQLNCTVWYDYLEGFWSDSLYHNGYISYQISKGDQEDWILQSTTRNYCIDDLTQEDIDEGVFIDDDQQQILFDFGYDLELAKQFRHRSIVAVGIGLPNNIEPMEAAKQLYETYIKIGGKEII